ncbi:MAG: hypothetical protein BGO67_12670 [Alphaproteobacteria bacterium 41-28]|nr:MAG: hypothetical protein BGO67_12670 [Alphaproteobacteria bacterium 41-28]
MTNKIKLFFSLLAFFIFSLTSSKGFIVVDFEDISNGKTRIVALNTRTQQLLLYKEVSQVLNERLNGYVLSFASPGNIQVQSDSPQEAMIVRSKKVISVDQNLQQMPCASYNIYSSQQITIKSPQEIEAILPKPKKKEAAGANFPIDREGDKGIRTLESLSNAYKGALGELATTLTMLSFGYTQHPSKYGGDNGLDGVFEDWGRKYLWLTQTKQEKKPRTAPNIMRNFLNEGKIWEAIQEMKRIGTPEVNLTATLINRYLRDRPQAVYKLAYRMMDKGMAQCQMCPLDIQGFPRKGPKLFNAPLKEKVKTVQVIFGGLEETPEKQLTLALNVIPLTSMPKERLLYLVEQAYDAQATAPMLFPTNNIQTFPAPFLKREEQTFPALPQPTFSLAKRQPTTAIAPPQTIQMQGTQLNQSLETTSQLCPFPSMNKGSVPNAVPSTLTSLSGTQNLVRRVPTLPHPAHQPILSSINKESTTTLTNPSTPNIQGEQNSTAIINSHPFPVSLQPVPLPVRTQSRLTITPSGTTSMQVPQNSAGRPVFHVANFPPQIPPVNVYAQQRPIQQPVIRNPKDSYNRTNLFNFLSYLCEKKENKRTIAAKLQGTEGASASSIDRLMRHINYAPTKEYEPIWGALKDKYSEEFQEWLSE